MWKLKKGYGLIEFLESNIRYQKLEAYLYFVRFNNDNEQFYKIGVTSKSIKERFYGYPNYNIELIKEVKTTMLDAYKKEKQFKIDFSNYKYIPKYSFSGQTECFRDEIYSIMFPG